MNDFIVDKLLVKTLKGENTSKIPIWLMRQAGRYLPEYNQTRKKCADFLDMCYNPEIVSEITLQPIKRFDLDAAIIFSDIMVIPHALGCKIEFISGKGPITKPIENQRDLLNPEKVIDHLIPVLEAITNVKSTLAKEKSLIGFAGAPLTIAAYIVDGCNNRDFPKTKKLAYSKFEDLNAIIEKITDATCIYLEHQIKRGVDVIQIFDTHAGILSPELFEKLVINPTKKIVSFIHERYKGFPIIGFPKSIGSLLKDYVIKTAISAVSIDYHTPLPWVKDNINIPIQGNLDPYLLAYNKNQALEQSKKILEFSKNLNLVFNLGHGILPETPIENVQELVNLVRNFLK